MFWGHDGRIARNMLAKKTGDQPGLHVVAAADIDADKDMNGFATIEIGYGIGLGSG
jgi:hypothetical protein